MRKFTRGHSFLLYCDDGFVFRRLFIGRSSLFGEERSAGCRCRRCSSHLRTLETPASPEYAQPATIPALRLVLSSPRRDINMVGLHGCPSTAASIDDALLIDRLTGRADVFRDCLIPIECQSARAARVRRRHPKTQMPRDRRIERFAGG